jgi:3-oxoacyl-[acyl-carrier protein] reductase
MSNFAKTEDGRVAILGMQHSSESVSLRTLARSSLFLASDEARWIIGDTIHVDGGSKL